MEDSNRDGLSASDSPFEGGAGGGRSLRLGGSLGLRDPSGRSYRNKLYMVRFGSNGVFLELLFVAAGMV